MLPRPARWAVTAAVIGTVFFVGCGRSSSATVVPPCRTGSGVTANGTTKSYVIQVNVGPIENMYSPSQVTAQHLTEGEVMLGGQMTATGAGGDMGSMPGMGAMPGMGGAVSASDRHLEAHVCSKATGMPVQGAAVTISVIDDSVGNVAVDVPIAIMQGIGQGASDYHYGNNVVMAPGSAYTIVVTVGGEKAVFRVRLPAA